MQSFVLFCFVFNFLPLHRVFISWELGLVHFIRRKLWRTSSLLFPLFSSGPFTPQVSLISTSSSPARNVKLSKVLGHETEDNLCASEALLWLGKPWIEARFLICGPAYVFFLCLNHNYLLQKIRSLVAGKEYTQGEAYWPEFPWEETWTFNNVSSEKPSQALPSLQEQFFLKKYLFYILATVSSPSSPPSPSLHLPSAPSIHPSSVSTQRRTGIP